MKCPNCTNFVMDKADKCSCGYEIVKAIRVDLCDKCKRERGCKTIIQKATEHRQEKSRWICYNCHHAEENKRFYLSTNSTTYKTKEEANFAKALDNHQRALFYGDPLDYKALEKTAWERNKKRYGGL